MSKSGACSSKPGIAYGRLLVLRKSVFC
ncbi:hypothetical protein C5167_022503 [Papaver somniferum]|uniref:Uncharacterized protein n=1 Tax=Papaver somniferum TaxID=3469 RepID=A0A4Y7JHZ8_PAPSO|nr:hypothetical protein C5167_022503 [Papaver somniferum]